MVFVVVFFLSLLLFLLLLCFVLFLGNRGVIPGTEQLEASKKTFFLCFVVVVVGFCFVLFCFCFCYSVVVFSEPERGCTCNRAKGGLFFFLHSILFVSLFVLFLFLLILFLLLLLKNVLYKNQREIGCIFDTL